MVLNIYAEHDGTNMFGIYLQKVFVSPIDMVILWKYNDVSELRCILPMFEDLKITEDMFLSPQGEEVYCYKRDQSVNVFLPEWTLFYIDNIKIARRGDAHVYIVQAFDCVGLLKRRAMINEYWYSNQGAQMMQWAMGTDSAGMEGNDAQKQRELPFFAGGTSYGYADMAFGGTRYFYATAGQTKLDATILIAKAVNCGFNTRWYTNGRLGLYMAYHGTQRDGTLSSVDIGESHVILEEELGNISDAEYTTGVGNYANVMYVNSPGFAGWPWALYTIRVVGDTYQIINPNAPPPVVSTHPTGMKRFEGVIAGPSHAGNNAIMFALGKDQLDNRRKTRLVTGTITDTGAYKIMRDFWLGDVVEVRNARWDISMSARVTAFIQDFSGGFLKNRIEIGDPAPVYSDVLRLKEAGK